MSLSRRDLLTASALLLAGPGATLRAAREAAPGGTPMVLCWNENPYGPSPAARLAVSRSIAQGCRYPADAEIQELVEALAGHEGGRPGRLLPRTRPPQGARARRARRRAAPDRPPARPRRSGGPPHPPPPP